MEIDLNELDLYEKQLAEKRHTKSNTSASTSTAETAHVERSVDEIDAYLDQLALELKAKDEHRSTPTANTRPNNHLCNASSSSGSQTHTTTYRNSSHTAEKCTGQDASDSMTEQIPKTSFALLLLSFLSILAYVNTLRCKEYMFNLNQTNHTQNDHHANDSIQ